MGIYSVKPAFQRRLTVVRDWCIRRGVRADALTVTGVVFSIVGGAALYLSEYQRWLLLLVPVLAMGRITMNALDGMVASATGSARPFGEVFNEFADRLSDVAWFTGLAVAIDSRAALYALVIVLLSSYLGTVTKAAGGSRIYGGVMGKADRMIAFSVFALGAYFWGPRSLEILVWVVLGGAVITIVQRMVIARRSLANKSQQTDAP